MNTDSSRRYLSSYLFSIFVAFFLIIIPSQASSNGVGTGTGGLGQPASTHPSFQGAMASLRSNTVTVGDRTDAVVTWTHEEYDTNNFFTPNSNFFTIPSGVTYVRLSAQLLWQRNSVGQRYMWIEKNGSLEWVGRPLTEDNPVSGAGYPAGQKTSSVYSAIVPVTAGDKFRVVVHQTSGGNLTVAGGSGQGVLAWFAIEVLQ